MRIIFYLLSLITVVFLFTSCSNDENILSSENHDGVNPSEVTIYKFPNVDEIASSQEFEQAALAAWEEMLTYSTPQHRREIGFYIYYDRDKNSYEIGDWIYGPLEPYSSHKPSSIVFGEALFPNKVCAFFHCHPPYLSYPGRGTGPSQSDIDAADKLGLPGLLLDFSADYIDVFHIYEADGPFLHKFGPTSRGDQMFF